MTNFILLLLFVFTEASLPLPSYITPCSQSDPDLNACFENSGNAAIHKMANGDPAYNVQSLKPFKLEPPLEVHMPLVTLLLTDISMDGLDQFTISNPNVDLKKQEIAMTLSSPLIVWKAHYQLTVDLAGAIVPSKIEGNVTISFPNGVYYITTEYEFFDLNNEQYANVTNAFAKFENLEVNFEFIGSSLDPATEEAWNEAKSHFVNQEIQEACGGVVATFFNDILNLVPFKQVFIP